MSTLSVLFAAFEFNVILTIRWHQSHTNAALTKGCCLPEFLLVVVMATGMVFFSSWRGFYFLMFFALPWCLSGQANVLSTTQRKQLHVLTYIEFRCNRALSFRCNTLFLERSWFEWQTWFCWGILHFTQQKQFCAISSTNVICFF